MKKLMLLLTMLISIMLTGCSSSGNIKNNNTTTTEYLAKSDTNDSFVAKELQDTPDNVATVISNETTWAYDVTDPSVVLENSNYFLKVRVKAKEKTKYFTENTIMPSSIYNLEVLDIIINDDGNVSKNIKLTTSGGIVSMQDYVDTLDDTAKEKAHINKLSKKELKEDVMINDESYYALQQGQEYYICVRDITDDEIYKGYYCMPEGGYDVFEEKDGNYINVLTGRTLTIPN